MDLTDACALHQLTLSADGRSKATQSLYLSYERRFLEFLEMRGIPPTLDALNPLNVRLATEWFRKDRATGPRGGQVATQTFVDTLKLWANFLEHEGVWEISPLTRVKRVRVAKVLRQPFSKTEIQALWAASRQTRYPVRDEALLLLLLDTGMRIGEAMTLTLDKLHLDERHIVVGLEGKGRAERLVPIGDPTKRDGGHLLHALRAWLRARPAAPTSRLFVDRRGFAIGSGAGADIFARIGAIAGVANCIPHRARHAQPLQSPVLTPTGWRPIGSLHPGDEVIGADGCATPVVGVYPQGQQEVVRVTFTDGAAVECTLDHLWTVRPSLSKCWPRGADHWRVMSTRELLASSMHWHTPVVGPVEFAPQDQLTVEPYTLGALLGDGHLGANVVLASACDEYEVVERIRAQLPAGMRVSGQPGRHLLAGERVVRATSQRIVYSRGEIGARRPDLDSPTIGALYADGRTTTEIAAMFETTLRTINKRVRASGRSLRRAIPVENPLRDAFVDLGLIGSQATDKFIPAQYLRASVADRIELLRGLMDTDGYVNKHGTATFTTISPDLAAGAEELVRSLGGIARLTVRKPYVTAKHDAYRIGVRTPFNPFHMSRKRDRYAAANPVEHTGKPGRGQRYELVRTIKSIEPIGVAEAVCIEVAADDGLYVAQDYVVTHNTYATHWLTVHPGDVLGLQRVIGHTSDAVTRDYIHLSQTTIADRAGRASLVESLSTPKVPAPVSPLPSTARVPIGVAWGAQSPPAAALPAAALPAAPPPTESAPAPGSIAALLVGLDVDERRALLKALLRNDSR